MNNLNKKVYLPDAQNVFAVKQFRNMYGDDLYMNMVEKNDSMKMHPGQRRINKKKKIEEKIVEVINDTIMTIADDDLNQRNYNNESSSDNIFLDDQQQQAYNDGLQVEDCKDSYTCDVVDDEVILEDDDNYLSFNDDVDDDDDWCNGADEEYDDRIIHQMHGGGGCFEDGTADDVNDQQEEDIVKSYYSNSFNILDDCLNIAFKIKCRAEGIFHKNGLDVQDLYPNSSATVKDCSLLIRNFTSRHKLSEQGELSLVFLLKKLLPSNAKLPLHQTKYGSYVSDIDKVLNEDNLISGVKTFDICPLLGCTVFVGNDEFKFQCPSCGTNRYTNCAECTRNKKPIMMVNGNNNRCQHSGRLAKKQLSYKCILPTILKAVLQPCFLQLINFKSYNYINGNNQNEYICDIGDSIAYKEGMEEMKKQFNELKLKQSIVNNVIISDKTIHVPLLLSIFFDGVQMFSTKQNIPYSPLFLTILNLPPLVRSIIGLGKLAVLFIIIYLNNIVKPSLLFFNIFVLLGMFKLASFTSERHSAAELFLFKECLMKEIQYLNDGYAIEINGQSYLIQCRLIQFVFDTKEIGESLCVHHTNGYEICPFCYDTKGWYLPNKHKMIICDQRYLLPLYHGLRVHGQTANCCPNFAPEDYYRSYSETYKGRFFYSLHSKNAVGKTIIPTAATEDVLLNPRVAQDMGLNLVPFFFNVCDEANREIIINFLFHEATPSIWFHNQSQYPMELFTKSIYLYYEYCNYKPYKPLFLKDKKFHQENAIKVNKIRATGIKVEHSMGVKDDFYGFLSKYVSLEKHLNFDPAHVIKNIYDYIYKLWTADLPIINEGLFKNNSVTKCWPFIKQLSDKKESLPWNISKANQEKIDAWMLSIHVPMGYKNSFEATSIFAYTQMSKFNVKMNIIKSIFPLIFFLLRNDMPVEYRAIFMMFSELIVDLSSPVIDTSTINSLYENAIEFVNLFQGLIPHTEHHMVYHSLIHLPQHIPVAGLLKNWSSYAGERGNSIVKSFIKKGGANYEKTSNLRYNRHESVMLESDESPYNFNINGIIDRNSYMGRTLLDNREFYIDDTKSSFVYNPFRMLIYGEQCECINTYMTHFEASNFLNSLIKEIMKQCRNMNEAKEKSELFSLYCLHLQLIQTYKTSWYKRTNIDVIYETTDIKFYDFLSILYAIRKNKNVDNQLEPAKKQIMEQVEKSEGDEFILLKKRLIIARRCC